MAAESSSNGLETGGVAVHAFNCPEWFFAALGAMHANWTVSGIYTTNTYDQASHILRTSNVRVLVLESEEMLSSVYGSLLEDFPAVTAVLLRGGDASPGSRTPSWDAFIARGVNIASDALPPASLRWFDGHVRFIAPGPYITSYVTFLLVLLFGALPGVGLGDPQMFLDKVCIHQTDPVKKAQGIAAINVFLMRSARMLVCYAENAPGQGYFERLWCIFELGAFTRRAGVGRLELLELHAPVRIPCSHHGAAHSSHGSTRTSTGTGTSTYTGTGTSP